MGVCPGGRGGCAGGRICPPLRDSKVISSLRASISWACNCTSWTKRCRSRMSALRLPVNSVPSDFCREFSICSSSFFSCNKTVKVSNLCVFSRVSCVTLPLYESILLWVNNNNNQLKPGVGLDDQSGESKERAEPEICDVGRIWLRKHSFVFFQ